MADAGVMRDPGRLPWLEPYRAPPRRKSNRRAGVTATIGAVGLAGVFVLLTRDLIPLPAAEPEAPQAIVVLPAPADLQPEIVLPPLQSRDEEPVRLAEAEPARLVRPARRVRRNIKAVPTSVAYSEVVRHQSGEHHEASVEVSEACPLGRPPLP